MAVLMEGGLQIIPFNFVFCNLEALLRVTLEVGGGVCIHNLYAMNNVHTLLLEIPNTKFFLLI